MNRIKGGALTDERMLHDAEGHAGSRNPSIYLAGPQARLGKLLRFINNERFIVSIDPLPRVRPDQAQLHTHCHWYQPCLVLWHFAWVLQSTEYQACWDQKGTGEDRKRNPHAEEQSGQERK